MLRFTQTAVAQRQANLVAAAGLINEIAKNRTGRAPVDSADFKPPLGAGGYCETPALILWHGGFKFEVLDKRKMKSARLTTALLIGVALMSNGCASVSPSNEYYPTPQQEMDQEQFTKTVADENADEDFVLAILYWAFYFGGSIISNTAQ